MRRILTLEEWVESLRDRRRISYASIPTRKALSLGMALASGVFDYWDISKFTLREIEMIIACARHASRRVLVLSMRSVDA
jgi:hypothetical protein